MIYFVEIRFTETYFTKSMSPKGCFTDEIFRCPNRPFHCFDVNGNEIDVFG
jgi:hypothetical protein